MAQDASHDPPGDSAAPVAAFFDMDRTLINVNSALLWARAERRQNLLKWTQLVKALWLGGLYHLSLVNFEAAFNAAMEHYRSVPGEELDRRTREFFESEVRPRIRPGALEALEWHRHEGHLLVLLTSTSSFAAQAATEAWGFDHWIANRFLTDDEGLLTGTCETPLCYGIGKVQKAEFWASQHGVRLEDSWFYSDSYTDLPMLERVRHPRVVAPDPRLRRVARKRGWPILDW